MNLARWTALPLLFALFVGCESAEEEPDYFTDMVNDLDSVQAGLEDGTRKIDSVVKSLDKLQATTGDLRGPLSDLDKAIAGLDDTAARIRGLGSDLNAKEAAFQKSWSEDIKDVESANLRRTAEKGRSDVEAAFTSLEQKSNVLGNSYREWESKVKSIQASLQRDLSPGNLQSLSSKIAEVRDSAPKLKEGFRMFSKDIDALSSSMRTAVP